MLGRPPSFMWRTLLLLVLMAPPFWGPLSVPRGPGNGGAGWELGVPERSRHCARKCGVCAPAPPFAPPVGLDAPAVSLVSLCGHPEETLLRGEKSHGLLTFHSAEF